MNFRVGRNEVLIPSKVHYLHKVQSEQLKQASIAGISTFQFEL